MQDIIFILTAFALILLNAFFVAAEFGMVKLRNTRVAAIREIYGMRGRILHEVHSSLDAYLSACQLGITLSSIGLGWIGEPAVAHLLRPLFVFMGIASPQVVSLISFAIAFALISFLHIVIGELMPKSLAIRQAEAVSIWTAVPLYAFYWTMYPAIWLLNNCSNFLLTKMGVDTIHDGEKFYSTDEIRLILSSSHVHGELTKAETEILEHTLEFADLKVTEVMRTYDDMVMLDINADIETSFKLMLENRFSRYPVFDRRSKEIIGIIHVKDIFAAMLEHKKITNLQTFMRPILKVSHSILALDLLNQFRAGMTHFAVVYKTKENILGFITLDNLLHVLIGRIKDEYHLTHDEWQKNPDGSLTVAGECSIYSLEKAIDKDVTLSEDEKDIDVLAGLLIAHAGHLPKQGERISFKEFDAVIEEIEGSHIISVRIYPKVARA